MLIDCDACTAHPTSCADCVVGVLLGTPTVPVRDPAAPREPGGPLPLEFGPVERRALEVLADHGLIPRLRLVTTPPDESPADAAAPAGRRSAVRRTRDAG